MDRFVMSYGQMFECFGQCIGIPVSHFHAKCTRCDLCCGFPNFPEPCPIRVCLRHFRATPHFDRDRVRRTAHAVLAIGGCFADEFRVQHRCVGKIKPIYYIINNFKIAHQ